MSLRKWILLSVVFAMLAGCNNQWSSGDRVLVSKVAYDAGITEPRRYDVVVFKYPRGPVDHNTPKNYIKRLLGLPGELLAIFFGRVYRWAPQPGDPPPFNDLKADGSNANELFEHTFTHPNDDRSKKWFETGDDTNDGKERGFEILRKPPHVMLAMRRVVYDNDYQARDLKGKLDRWTPNSKSAWKNDAATGFVNDGKSGDKIDWLRYQHLLRPEGAFAGGIEVKPSLITDVMDYNSFQPRMSNDAPHWVGDLMVECTLDVDEPTGQFSLELSRGVFRYQARWDLATGKCKLVSLVKGKDGKMQETELDVAATRVKSPGSYQLRFANIDARLTVWVDRELPFGDGQPYAPPDIRGPHEKNNVWSDEIEARRGPTKNDLEPASIGSKGASVKISHVRIWRDTFYTTSESGPDYRVPDREFLTDPARWDVIRKSRFTTMYVQPKHYLCLGDNSQASADSRNWGLVPERLMLGRALVVYFPLERMGAIR